MRTFATIVIAATAFLAVSCTVQITGSSGTGKVVISTQRSGSDRSVGLAQQLKAGLPIQKTAQTFPSSRAAARDLSASTDIASITYSVTNTNASSKESSLSGPLDPTDPYLELYLTPGQTYKIVVDVVPTASAPGRLTGVTRYGDSTEFTVPTDGSWSFVLMSIHPTRYWILEPNYPYYYHYVSNTAGYGGVSLFSQSASTDPTDSNFYGPDGKLYYFSKSANGLFIWSDSAAPGVVLKNGTSPDYSGTADGIVLLAAAPDTIIPDTVWLLAKDTATTPNRYGIYYLDTSTSSGAYKMMDITTDVWGTGLTGGPTGIAVYGLWYFYVTFNLHDTSSQAYGGIRKFGLGDGLVAQYPVGVTPGRTYFTDVAVHGGRVYALSSPIFNTSGANYGTLVNSGLNGGTASAYKLDLDLNLLDSRSDSYNGLMTQPLVAPARLLGFNEGVGMFFSQQPWDGNGANGFNYTDTTLFNWTTKTGAGLRSQLPL